ncbi:uncharacterized protein LOC121201710 [Betta splendens]|uniref:Gypsy retrotransposon integrase-like protein 1 n=1 Tax=Betta splendens TaxID=158456 RepID=A0A8M1H2K6_BETSP|nr:uncharacterized protein LOC121201710 [Betta splendens]
MTSIQRQRFRSLHVENEETPRELCEETPRELYVRLKELYGKWVQPKDKTTEEISEIMILEQYLRMLSPELQVWIKEHDPRTASKAASLADMFVAARPKNRSWAYKSWKTAKDDQRPGLEHQDMLLAGGKPPVKENQTLKGLSRGSKGPVCYLCGQEGHIKPRCPQNIVNMTQICCVPRKEVVEEQRSQYPLKTITVEIDGRALQALIDTGSTQTLVRRQYVPPHAISTDDTIPVCCVHGDERTYPIAEVYIKVDGQMYLLKVGITDNLPFPVVLGHDLPTLVDLINPVRVCNAVMTRAQAKERMDSPGKALQELPFYDAQIEAGVVKAHTSRRQRRQERFRHTVVAPTGAIPELPRGFELPENICELQQQDASLAGCLRKASKCAEDDLDMEGYCIQEGILYRCHKSVRQLMVPKVARDIILALGHSVPWAGHLGKHKTAERIQRHFPWPGLRKDVAQFCRSCPQCQQTSPQLPSKAPLHPLPVIGTPFLRLGMDVMGPVERSKAGNRFMLVITDYATRYPEVFPLRSIKAKPVAFCLVQFFSRVGFPQEILTDQGTNFMSKLLKDVYQLLGIWGERTTPYHP